MIVRRVHAHVRLDKLSPFLSPKSATPQGEDPSASFLLVHRPTPKYTYSSMCALEKGMLAGRLGSCGCGAWFSMSTATPLPRTRSPEFGGHQLVVPIRSFQRLPSCLGREDVYNSPRYCLLVRGARTVLLHTDLCPACVHANNPNATQPSRRPRSTPCSIRPFLRRRSSSR